jgi:hypothetical protein
MPRQELHSETLPPIEQKPPIDLDDPDARSGDIVIVDESIARKEYLDELTFMREPVTIRLEPSSEKNAASAFPVWTNGKRAEVFQRGRWEEIGYLPTGVELIVRRHTLETIIRAKIDTISTGDMGEAGEMAKTSLQRPRAFTSALQSFSIIEDNNPRGRAWAAEMRRRNF